ncbi:hypothetical protein RIF29_20347 [Crotalaria pallida]|uniref:Uncharacterized protein n=1 Tax=Crotalaria pallida TaxID=3830 RepID=A0AAN9I7E1_CROPI
MGGDEVFQRTESFSKYPFEEEKKRYSTSRPQEETLRKTYNLYRTHTALSHSHLRRRHLSPHSHINLTPTVHSHTTLSSPPAPSSIFSIEARYRRLAVAVWPSRCRISQQLFRLFCYIIALKPCRISVGFER